MLWGAIVIFFGFYALLCMAADGLLFKLVALAGFLLKMACIAAVLFAAVFVIALVIVLVKEAVKGPVSLFALTGKTPENAAVPENTAEESPVCKKASLPFQKRNWRKGWLTAAAFFAVQAGVLLGAGAYFAPAGYVALAPLVLVGMSLAFAASPKESPFLFGRVSGVKKSSFSLVCALLCVLLPAAAGVLFSL